MHDNWVDNFMIGFDNSPERWEREKQFNKEREERLAWKGIRHFWSYLKAHAEEAERMDKLEKQYGHLPYLWLERDAKAGILMSADFRALCGHRR